MIDPAKPGASPARPAKPAAVTALPKPADAPAENVGEKVVTPDSCRKK